ncbi:MAG: Type 1 glutamine amidotransferase-like domain-containing protein [Acidimicrobiales bacterium]
MAELEGALIEGRPPRYVQLPTAAAPEGEEAVDRWIALGAAQAKRLGVEQVPLLVVDRDSAERAELAELVAGAGLVYLSGGNPVFLTETLRGTAVWVAIESAWRSGSALAGCSAGAMALAAMVPNIRNLASPPVPGLAVVPKMMVLPHFDRFHEWVPGVQEALVDGLQHDTLLIGIDEETAIVSDGTDLARWAVRGLRSVWVFDTEGKETQYHAGDVLEVC